MRLPTSLIRFIFPFRRETPYASAFTSKLKKGLCISHAKCGCQPFCYASIFFLMCRVQEFSQAAECICHGWAKGQAVTLFLTIVYSGLLVVTAVFQCGWHHHTFENLSSFNSKGTSAQEQGKYRNGSGNLLII